MEEKLAQGRKILRNSLAINAKTQIDIAKRLLESEEISIQQTKISLKTLNDYRERLTKLNAEVLVDFEDTAEAEADCVNAIELDQQLLDTISAISTCEEALSQPENGDRFAKTQSHTSLTDSRVPSVKLPKLEIEKFSGDPMKWAEFWDSYSSTIHNNDDLSDVDKFKYLRGFLSSDALGVINGYMLTSANYSAAVEALSDRFGNKQLAIFAHFEAMLGLSTASYDIKQLQHTYDECEKHIRSLVALGLAEDTFGQVFTPIILSKLPPYVKMELYRKNASEPWELSNLREWLKEEIRARDYSQRVFASQSNGQGQSGDRNGKRQQFNNSHKQTTKVQGTSAALVANEEKSTPRCGFCGEGHYADQCQKYPDTASRKQRILELRKCYKCLSNKHIAKNCQFARSCAHCHKLGHHRSICRDKFGSQEARSDQNTALTVQEPQIASNMIAQGERAILQTALAKVKAPDGSTVLARLLFDTGCTRSFITTKLSQSVQTRRHPDEVVAIAGFSDKTRKTSKYKTVEFDILLPKGGSKSITANVIPSISCPVQKFPLDTKVNPVIHQLQLAEPIVSSQEMVTIDILLGTDYYYDFVGSEQIRLPNGIVFLSSILGFIATGKVKYGSSIPQKGSALFVSATEAIPESTFHVEKFWSLEDIGVKACVESTDDEDAVESFKKSVTVSESDGRYSVDWPWKKVEKELPNNYQLALGRLKSLKKRIDGTPKVLEQYDQTIKDQIEKGIIEEVPEKDTGNKIHYIPHHCVLTPNKTTTKLRIVYDASAKASKNASSLNECLNRGPVLLDDLCGLLIRFRTHQIAIVSDIEKAFLQVGLNETSRDVTRFLWLKDPKGSVTKDNLIEYRFCRVPFGVNSSMFLLAATILFHIDSSDRPVAKDIKGNTYVDNAINGKYKLVDAELFYREAKELFREASMNLREWYTNSEALRKLFAPSDLGKDQVTKVLGLEWDTAADTLSTSSFSIQKESVSTKRQMLSNIAKVFDPCGYYAPITVTGKILIQTLWKDQYGWDESLPSSIVQNWNECASDLMQIAEHKLPRYLFDPKVDSSNAQYHLHCFTDASSKAYGACIYIVREVDSVKESILVFAKSRVAPLKELTIPRMELMGVVIGVRIMEFVADQMQLPIQSKTLWSDSQCVLHWLNKASLETKFVKNRVAEIKTHQDVTFRYVPTNDNPADLVSRGCSYDHLSDSKLWWQGPKWLIESPEGWPKNIVPKALKSDEDDSGADVLVLNDVNRQQDSPTDIDISKYSSLSRLLRVTAWVFRFVNNVKRCRNSHTPEKGHLQSAELANAQKYWETVIQKKHFGEVLTNFKSKKRNKVAEQLSLFQDDDGILRRGGRLGNADIPDDAKWPILLPKNCHYSDLVIADCHSRMYHSGVGQTLANVRMKYWVVQGRRQVKKVISSCRICRILYGGPFRYPESPSLPKFRVGTQRPFETTGIDYMGPLQIKLGKQSSESAVKKVWICLFTCAAVRAVHLEVVTDLSAQQFLMALRRFTALYRKPQLIISDNGKQFKASERFLTKVLPSPEVQDFAASEGISWKFITERAPWMGGFYERMVGVVKKALKSSLDKRCVNLVELQTVASEVASIVNSRPITYLDSDNTALTPAHFIGGPCSKVSSFSDVPSSAVTQTTTYSSIVTTWKRIQAIMNSFWRTWRYQYLLSLREASHFKDRNATNIEPQMNSVVLIKEDLPRSYWRMGKIVGFERSSDGKVRTATIELPSHRRINRAVRHLYPIEIPSDIAVDNDTNNIQFDDNISEVSGELLAVDSAN